MCFARGIRHLGGGSGSSAELQCGARWKSGLRRRFGSDTMVFFRSFGHTDTENDDQLLSIISNLGMEKIEKISNYQILSNIFKQNQLVSWEWENRKTSGAEAWKRPWGKTVFFGLQAGESCGVSRKRGNNEKAKLDRTNFIQHSYGKLQCLIHMSISSIDGPFSIAMFLMASHTSLQDGHGWDLDNFPGKWLEF